VCHPEVCVLLHHPYFNDLWPRLLGAVLYHYVYIISYHKPGHIFLIWHMRQASSRWTLISLFHHILLPTPPRHSLFSVGLAEGSSHPQANERLPDINLRDSNRSTCFEHIDSRDMVAQGIWSIEWWYRVKDLEY